MSEVVRVDQELAPVLARIGQVIAAQPAAPTLSLDEQERTWWLGAASALGVPTRLIPASLTAGRPSLAVEAVQAFLSVDADAGRCLVLMGNTGTGKSWAAAAALRAWAPRRSLRPRFFYFPALCGALLDPVRRADALGHACAAGLVVLDDVGTEYLKAGGLLDALVDEIVWTREANQRLTVVTTNLLREELTARLSDRIVDRLRGDWGRLYAVTGPSFREAGAAEVTA